MPKYMNNNWLERQLNEIRCDKDLSVMLDNGMRCSELLLDSLQKCYSDESVMDN